MTLFLFASKRYTKRSHSWSLFCSFFCRLCDISAFYFIASYSPNKGFRSTQQMTRQMPNDYALITQTKLNENHFLSIKYSNALSKRLNLNRNDNYCLFIPFFECTGFRSLPITQTRIISILFFQKLSPFLTIQLNNFITNIRNYFSSQRFCAWQHIHHTMHWYIFLNSHIWFVIWILQWKKNTIKISVHLLYLCSFNNTTDWHEVGSALSLFCVSSFIVNLRSTNEVFWCRMKSGNLQFFARCLADVVKCDCIWIILLFTSIILTV